MKFLNCIAAVALVLTPAFAMAQTAPGSQADCADNEVFQPAGDGNPAQCLPAVGTTGQGALPVLSTIPAGAIVVGGLVILAGVVIGVVAATDDDNNAVSTSATSTN